MMPFKIVMVLCLAALSCAEYDTLGSCMLKPFAKAPGGAKDHIKRVTDMGEMAVVAHDLGKNEKDFTCIRMKLDASKQTYTIKYIDGSGTEQLKTGNLTVVREKVLFGLGGENVYYKMDGLQGTGLFNNGELNPMFADKKALVLYGCRSKIFPPVYATSTYYLTTLKRAKENPSCNCDWGSL